MFLDPQYLEYHVELRPGTKHVDINSRLLTDVCSLLADDPESQNLVSPDILALEYYVRNHAMALVNREVKPKEHLGKHLPIVEGYYAMLSSSAARMFKYLLLICSRESRHINSLFEITVDKSYNNELIEFQLKLQNAGSAEATQYLIMEPPKVSIGVYVDWLLHLFQAGSFSSSYGGAPWARITEALHKFVYGKYTAEGLLDVAFALCHNNGPIFNKGAYFCSVANSTMTIILDVQRAGFIPQYIQSKGVDYVGTHLWEEYLKLTEIVGTAFTGTVDWGIVDSVGEGNYTKLIKSTKGKKGAVKITPKVAKKTKTSAGASPAVAALVLPGLALHIVKKPRVKSSGEVSAKTTA